ncbi:transcriptional regulator [Glutamicibacter uratoxydans]|uniref:Transcriptional regulator n=1 Tax=Glutamicibacter uratoxydans TaxID=43667 RepID=A0A4Y4DNU0_GLUUR|nr:transcriptional regulator [Glutamicibacter uratoxydans]
MNGEYLRPVFVISVAAQLADMHPQTLRQYDRIGLVSPSRQSGKQRRYSQRDVSLLRQVQSLSKDGVSLEGIKRILDLQDQVANLQTEVNELRQELSFVRQGQSRIFAAGTMAGDVVTLARGMRPSRPEPPVTLFPVRRAIGR